MTVVTLVEIRCGAIEGCRSLLGSIPDLPDYRGFVLELKQCPTHSNHLLERADGSVERRPPAGVPRGYLAYVPGMFDGSRGLHITLTPSTRYPIDVLEPVIAKAKKRLTEARAKRRRYRPFVHLLNVRPVELRPATPETEALIEQQSQIDIETMRHRSR